MIRVKDYQLIRQALKHGAVVISRHCYVSEGKLERAAILRS